MTLATLSKPGKLLNHASGHFVATTFSAGQALAFFFFQASS
jgi:hypothetical protein